MRTNLTLAHRPRAIAVVEAPLGAGAIDRGCQAGPAAFRASREPGRLSALGLATDWHAPPPPPDAPDLAVVSHMAGWLAATIQPLAAAGTRFVVIGGDHSCAIGTWSGLSRAVRPQPMGLVWIDAHLDMHRPETTHSGAINGMPVAVLTGHGHPRFTRIAGRMPALDPKRLCVVGVRSFEREEWHFARELGVRVIDMAEVTARGLPAALDEARAIASNGTAGYGVSLDLDAVDPRDAPGVGTPEVNGIRADDLLPAWRKLVGTSGCLGAEIVELNPFRDEGGRTVGLVGDLMAGLLSTGFAEAGHDNSS